MEFIQSSTVNLHNCEPKPTFCYKVMLPQVFHNSYEMLASTTITIVRTQRKGVQLGLVDTIISQLCNTTMKYLRQSTLLREKIYFAHSLEDSMFEPHGAGFSSGEGPVAGAGPWTEEGPHDKLAKSRGETASKTEGRNSNV